MYSVKQMKRKVLELVSTTDKEEVKNNFYTYCQNQELYRLEPEEITSAAALFLRKCEDAHQKNKSISSDEVQKFMEEARSEFDPRKKLEQAQDRLKQTQDGLKQAQDRLKQVQDRLEQAEEFLKILHASLPNGALPYDEWKNARIEQAKKHLLAQNTPPQSPSAQGKLEVLDQSVAPFSVFRSDSLHSDCKRKRSKGANEDDHPTGPRRRG